MKMHMNKDNLNIRGPPPPIFYNPKPTISKTPEEKSYSPKFDIKTQPGERYSDMVTIYAPLFWTRGPEALLKFVTLLNMIIRCQDMSTVSHKLGMTRNLVIR